MSVSALHHRPTAKPYSIATINTYLFLKEEELKRLTTVMECVRYQISPAETMRYVGGKKKL